MNCKNCRYWSDKIAMYEPEKGIVAICLAPSGFHHGKYTVERFFCHFWKLNKYGAVDETDETQEMYDADSQA
jgi:hypothetical protein